LLQVYRACARACVYVVVCIHACMYDVCIMYVCKHACMYMYVWVIYVCMYLRVAMYVCIMYVRMCLCMYLCMYVCIRSTSLDIFCRASYRRLIQPPAPVRRRYHIACAQTVVSRLGNTLQHGALLYDAPAKYRLYNKC
jgi:hypothetical protein